MSTAPFNRILLGLVLLSMAALVSANQDPRPETALEVPGDDDEIGDDPNDELGPAHEADPTMIPSDPDDMFQRMDGNKDKSLVGHEINDDEFLHFFGQAWTDPALAVPAMDTDKDGKVDREEFLAYTEPLTAVAYAKSDFHQSDSDLDGFLNFTEYQLSGHSMEDGVPAPGDTLHTDPVFLKRLQAGFDSMDSDKNDKLTSEEYVAGQGRDTFSRKDGDGDGKVTKVEFIAYEAKTGLSKSLAVEWFNSLDKDKSGYLTRVEDRGDEDWNPEDGEEDSEMTDDDDGESEADFEAGASMFASMDTNSDKAVSWDEFKAQAPEVDEETGKKYDGKAEFAQFDADGDGKISHDEYMGYNKNSPEDNLSDL